MTTIYVGNLHQDTTAERARALFERFGVVHSMDITPSGSRRRYDGFGLVEMDEGPARRAISALNGTVLDGTILVVCEATETHRRQVQPRHSRSLPEQPVGVSRQHIFTVLEIAKVDAPPGATGADWHRYVLACGSSRITGLHRGSFDEVALYAAGCAAAFNDRSVRGKTTPLRQRKA